MAVNKSAGTLDQILKYERTRYRGLDQRIVHYRESRIVWSFCKIVSSGNDHVLDVPSDYGRFTPLLLSKGFDVTVADINVNMLLRVKQRVNGILDCACANISKLPFKDNVFQGLLCMRLFKHIHSPEERMASFVEIARVVSNWAIVSLYTSSPVHKLVRKFRDFKTITMDRCEAIEGELLRSGFRILKTKPILCGINAQTIFLLELGTTPSREFHSNSKARLPV
ncbi:MAG: class I SAM-dependent methyltransferase [Candidatus Marinimicrobia bacterium]|nr:class I SAM-dependent methyltransferase [Candidatus Neomarinimicrobiota bacterium]